MNNLISMKELGNIRWRKDQKKGRRTRSILKYIAKCDELEVNQQKELKMAEENRRRNEEQMEGVLEQMEKLNCRCVGLRSLLEDIQDAATDTLHGHNQNYIKQELYSYANTCSINIIYIYIYIVRLQARNTEDRWRNTLRGEAEVCGKKRKYNELNITRTTASDTPDTPQELDKGDWKSKLGKFLNDL